MHLVNDRINRIPPLSALGIIPLLLLLLTVEASAQPGISVSGILIPDSTIRSGDITVRIWQHPRMTIVEIPDTLVFLYLPRNDLPLDSIARKNNLRGIVNCSFFDGVRGNARHAGWLSLYGERVTPLLDDRQLSHIVRFSGTSRKIECVPVKSFVPTRDQAVLEFQTGPLVIDSGKVRDDLITRSINGSTPHTRTLLAVLDRRQPFFVTVTDRVSLSELGAILRRISIFQHGRLDVVNLDGGSSVALYLRDLSGLNYNAGDRLPILIGFH